MEAPAMAIGGVVPVLNPALIGFVLMALSGGFLLVLALLRRNLALVTRHGINPFRLADIQRAADSSLSTRAAAAPFHRTLYGRIALALLAAGLCGLAVTVLVELFAR